MIHVSRVKRPRCSDIAGPRPSPPHDIAAAYEVPQLVDGRAGGVERAGDPAGEEHQDAVAVAQQFVQVARGEDDRSALVAALLELGPQVDDRFDVEPPGGLLQQHDLGARPDQGQQRPLLVAAGERLHRAGRRALDVVLGDALLRQPAAALPVDEEAGLLLGEQEVLGEGEPGDEALLQPGGGHVGHPPLLEVVVGLAGQVGVSRWMRPPVVGTSPAQARRKTALSAALHARQPDGLAPRGRRGRAASSWMRPCSALMPDSRNRRLAGAQDIRSPGGHLALEHHGDQAVDLERRQGLSDEPALPEHGHAGAELLHLLQLVRDEEDGLALGRQAAERVEELLALGGADARWSARRG